MATTKAYWESYTLHCSWVTPPFRVFRFAALYTIDKYESKTLFQGIIASLIRRDFPRDIFFNIINKLCPRKSDVRFHILKICKISYFLFISPFFSQFQKIRPFSPISCRTLPGCFFGSGPFILAKRVADEIGRLTTSPIPFSPQLYTSIPRNVRMRNPMPKVKAAIEEAGGTIEITAAALRETAGQAPSEMIQCTVRDSGIGISPEDQKSLFRSFFRADHPYVRRQSGTGLGLSITRMLIREQGGEIWVESELGRGSSFSFTLPTAEQRQP